MVLRLRSGSMTSSSASRNRSAAFTCTRSIANCSRNVCSTCSASLSRSSPVSTNTHVSWSPIALCTSAAATAESTPPESPQITRSVADLRADLGDGVLDDRHVRPRRPAAGRVVEERLQHLLAALGVRDLGVELHAVDAAVAVLERGDRHRVGARGDREARRRLRDRVAVAHPHDLLGRLAGEQRRRARRRAARCGRTRPCPVLRDLAAEITRDRAARRNRCRASARRRRRSRGRSTARRRRAPTRGRPRR